MEGRHGGEGIKCSPLTKMDFSDIKGTLSFFRLRGMPREAASNPQSAQLGFPKLIPSQRLEISMESLWGREN